MLKKKYLFLVLLVCVSLFSNAQYNYYYGNIHAHSSYSDGNKDSITSGYYYPGQDYYYTKNSFHMDFLGISEHNHYSAMNSPGMHLADFAKGTYEADTSNVDGTFVAMFGLEWGVINNGGHVIAYGIPGLVGWETSTGAWGNTNNYNIFCAKSLYTNFWSIVNSYPNAFCTLSHPQDLDYNDLLGNANFSKNADDAISGIAIRSGTAFSTTTNYQDAPSPLFETSFQTALAKGYHVGPTIDHDNHNTTFGRTNKGRTVVLANTLTRDEIMASYKANRFYASDDWDARVDFTVNGNVMGSNFITNSNSNISVSITDLQNNTGTVDLTKKIEIYYGKNGSNIRPTILTSNLSQNTLNFVHPTIANDSFYYYAKITQIDNDIIWTSPIWIKNTGSVVARDITAFNVYNKNETALLNWNTSNNLNTQIFEIEYSKDGIIFEKIGTINNNNLFEYNFSTYNFNEGLNFYRLKLIDINGITSYSEIIKITKNKIISNLVITPNPVAEKLSFTFKSIQTETLTCKIYSAEGREITSELKNLQKDLNVISMNVSILPKGLYYLVLSKPNMRIAEGTFIKL
jgi:trimeric autotransporter adhesin